VNRRSFLRLAGAVPFIGPFLAQLGGNPAHLEKLRAISLHIANAPKRLFCDWWEITNWSLNRAKSFMTDYRGI
jgi:hypothetical protein